MTVSGKREGNNKGGRREDEKCLEPSVAQWAWSRSSMDKTQSEHKLRNASFNDRLCV